MKNTSLKYSFPTINKSSSQANNINNLSLTQSNSSLKRNQNKKDNIENEVDEELSIIENLWDDLGVSINYQEEFKKFIRSVDNEQEKNEYLFLEKNKLRKFRESLLKLSVEISNRESNIFKLKKYNNYLEKYTKEKKEIEVNFFDKITAIIKFLRINAVNIIILMDKIREKCSYYELKGKYILNNANKSYNYDENYLINMSKNLKFINKSILFNYIETDNHTQNTDLFFSNCKNIITDDNKKLKIPISIELKNAINKCKYIILQDTLFNNIKNDNLMVSNRHIFSPKRIGIKNSYNNRTIIPSTTIKKISKSNSELSLLSGSDSRKFMTMFGHNKVNLSRTLYYLKRTMGNDYENLFLSLNKHKKLDMKKSGEIMDKYFHLHNQLNEDENNMISNNNNNKTILEKKNDEENNFTNKSNNNKKINIERNYLDEKKENAYNDKYDKNDKDNKISNRSNEMNINKSKKEKEKEKNKSKKVVNKNKSKSTKKEVNDNNKNKELNNNNIINEREDDKYNNYDSEKNKHNKRNEEDYIDLNNNYIKNIDNDINNNNNDIKNSNNDKNNNDNDNDNHNYKDKDNNKNNDKDNDINNINDDIIRNNNDLNNNNNDIKKNNNEISNNNDYIINNNNEIKNNKNDINSNNNDVNNNDISNNNNKDNALLNNENDKLIEKERINEENKESENDNSDNLKKDNNISELNEDEDEEENDIENKKKKEDKNKIRESDFVYNETKKSINNRELTENKSNKSNHSIESKGKLIKFKKYTEEEIKKLNDDEDDEEEEDEK